MVDLPANCVCSLLIHHVIRREIQKARNVAIDEAQGGI